jgi:hypothetical protein
MPLVVDVGNEGAICLDEARERLAGAIFRRVIGKVCKQRRLCCANLAIIANFWAI